MKPQKFKAIFLSLKCSLSSLKSQLYILYYALLLSYIILIIDSIFQSMYEK